ncbi:MAG: hypothetical protein GY906_23825 [bacterium]|nr:hypothetical protein [bacterium]
MQKLDSFTQAYLECMLWCETDEKTPEGGEPFDKNYSLQDLAPEALQQAVDDCKRFQRENSKALLEADYGQPDYTDEEMQGHDFWLTRNGHGCGFWDGDLREDIGQELTQAAHKFGECHPYLGDDGKIYLFSG